MTDSPSKLEFDKLKLLFAEPYYIKKENCNICIKQPSIGDILELGEKTFYGVLNIFIGNPTMYRLRLWDVGVDWNKISDYELFCSLIKTIEKNNPVASLIFGDIDFQKFDIKGKQIDEEKVVPVLVNQEQRIEIDEETYLFIAEYLRNMFNIFPKVEKAKGKTTKEMIIDEERMNLNNKENDTSHLLSLVSFCTNHPGFKYKLQELKDMGIVQFMDSVQRLQIYESTKALNSGMYSGMCDLSKVDKNLFNFIRDIDKK